MAYSLNRILIFSSRSMSLRTYREGEGRGFMGGHMTQSLMVHKESHMSCMVYKESHMISA